MLTKDFQAVVLAAGHGSRMTELTDDRPKCLLPVGQHPILYHSLNLLENVGFKDAIVVVLSSAQSQINSALSKCHLKIVPELVSIPSDIDEDWGTAESLQYLVSQERIKSDVVVVSCDIFTNSSLSELLLIFRQHQASIAALFFNSMNDAILKEVPPGAKHKNKPEKDIVAIDSQTSRLVFLSSASDFEENVPIKKSIIRRHAKISVHTDLLDAHVYVLSAKLVKFLLPPTSFSALKGEFLPYVVSKQHTRPPLKSENVQDKLTLLHKSLTDGARAEGIYDYSSYNDHKGDVKGAYHSDNNRCYAVMADNTHYAIRINSIPALWLANRLVASTHFLKDVRIDSTADVLSNQVEDSFVGPMTKVHEKTSIRASVLSEGIVVQPKTRILRSTVLLKTYFEEGCIIEDCVIGNNVKVGANCELKHCLVGANHVVPPGTKASFQVLTKSDRLMEI